MEVSDCSSDDCRSSSSSNGERGVAAVAGDFEISSTGEEVLLCGSDIDRGNGTVFGFDRCDDPTRGLRTESGGVPLLISAAGDESNWLGIASMLSSATPLKANLEDLACPNG